MRRSIGFLRFRREFVRFRKLTRHHGTDLPLKWADRLPCLTERGDHTSFDRHYVYHTAWAARIIARLAPIKHVDISSSLYFCGIVSAFVPVVFYDYRRVSLVLAGLEVNLGDLLALPFGDREISSLSCMHVVEHIGLGRYGESLDANADRKAMAELSRVIAPGGSLLFVVPVGRPRIVFNAHRVYSYRQVLDGFPELQLQAFSLIPDDSSGLGLIEDPTEDYVNEQEYGCGCFWFVRR